MAALFTAPVVCLAVMLSFDAYSPIALASLVTASLSRLVVDGMRASYYADGNNAAAFRLTSMYAALVFVAWAFWVWTGRPGGWIGPLTGQGVSSAVLIGVVIVSGGYWPTRESYQYFRSSVGGSWKLLGITYGASIVAQFLVPVGVLGAAGYSVLGVVRTSQSLVGLPLQVVRGLGPQFLAFQSKRHRASGSVSKVGFVAWVAAQGFLVALFVALLQVVPSHWVERFFGEVGPSVFLVLPLFAVASLVNQMVDTIELYCRATDRLGPFALVRAISVPITIVAAYVGALYGGSRGVGYALGCSYVIALTMGLSVIIRRRKQREWTHV